MLRAAPATPISRWPPAECASRSPEPSRESAFVPSSTGWPRSSRLGGFVLNEPAGALLEAEGEAAPGGGAAGAARGRGAAAGPEWSAWRSSRWRRAASAGSGSSRALRSGRARGVLSADAATCDECRQGAASTRPIAATGTRSSTAPTAARGSRSPAACPTTGRRPRWSHFEMCPECRREYEDPGDRRFHAQAERLPRLRPAGQPAGPGGPADRPRRGADAVAAAAAGAAAPGGSWRSRDSAAITSPAAPTFRRSVGTLRERKHRDSKPFALMAPDLEAARCARRADPRRGGAAHRSPRVRS